MDRRNRKRKHKRRGGKKVIQQRFWHVTHHVVHKIISGSDSPRDKVFQDYEINKL